MSNIEIDWNAPLEAVHEDGRVVPVRTRQGEGWPDWAGDYATHSPVGTPGVWRPDGTPWMRNSKATDGWRIRNVAPNKPVRTAAEMLERYEATFERLRHFWDGVTPRAITSITITDYETLALMGEIVADLTPPVDPDLIEARKAVAAMPMFAHIAKRVLAGEYDSRSIVQATLEAVRELERGQ